DHANTGIGLVEPPPRAHHRSGRAEPGDEVGDAPVGLLEDLHPRRIVVGLPVRRVVVLIRLEVPLGRGRQHLPGHADGAVAALQRVREHDPGSVRGDDALALLDRKSTRLNSSHLVISYAVFCLKKKKKNTDSKITHNRIIPSAHTYTQRSTIPLPQPPTLTHVVTHTTVTPSRTLVYTP